MKFENQFGVGLLRIAKLFVPGIVMQYFQIFFQATFLKLYPNKNNTYLKQRLIPRGFVISQCHVEKEYESTELVNFILDVEYPELLAHENDWTKILESLGTESGTCDSCYTAIPANLIWIMSFMQENIYIELIVLN